jgi:hypothetical protein
VVSNLPAFHHEVVVDTAAMRAFEVFTDLGTWWPLAVRSVLGAEGTVGFVRGRLVEQAVDGRCAVWGTVTRWAPGETLALTWHPGRSPEKAARLEVSFVPEGPQTLLTLEQAGWEGYDDPAGARDDYDRGWPRMLALFAALANARSAATPPRIRRGTRGRVDRRPIWRSEPRVQSDTTSTDRRV